MKIGIDINPLMSARIEKTGIENYMSNLVEHLASVDDKNQYILFGYGWRGHAGRVKRIKFSLPQKFSLKIKRVPVRLIRFLYSQNISLEFLFGKIDIFHILGPDVFYFKWGKKVITVYDLTFELFPQWHIKETLIWGERIYRLVCEADRIIAISENTKKDLIKLYKILPEKIKVIHLAADEIYRPINDSNALASSLQKYDLPNKFILFVGTLEPRKNLNRLIQAYRMLKERGGLEHKLVIVGRKGWLYEEIFKIVKNLGLSREIIFTGYVPEEVLVLLYNISDLFVYPSLYEGFGLPPLEAMSCGTPVITSNISSLPEVVGDAAILVNPYNVEEIAEAIERVLSDEKLQQRLRRKGLERAKFFSWEKTAKETIKVYEELGESK